MGNQAEECPADVDPWDDLGILSTKEFRGDLSKIPPLFMDLIGVMNMFRPYITVDAFTALTPEVADCESPELPEVMNCVFGKMIGRGEIMDRVALSTMDALAAQVINLWPDMYTDWFRFETQSIRIYRMINGLNYEVETL